MIKLNQIVKTYQNGKNMTHALHGIDMEVNRGEIFGIIGHSGAGKSTLVRTINLLEKPSSGKVIVDGVDLIELPTAKLQQERRKIGMIFQHFNLLSSATVADNIAFPLKLAKTPKTVIQKKVNELLDLVGLTGQGNKYPSQLSGGQKQRVGIARALANDPKVLLCDEATSALDPQTTNSILNLLLDINKKLHLTIVLITHEMHVIRSICDRVAVIHDGRLVEQGAVVEVFLKPQHPVTKQFIEQISDPVDFHREEANLELSAFIKINFLGESTYAPILSDAVQQSGAAFSILHGTISKMKDTPYGQLFVRLDGSLEAREATIHTLRDRGLEVEVL
ncbi:methionine ABC transporter ATP-binding protein [Paenibacillus larvae]|uniref:Methionine import ATP-binding protein MetN n=5 Tax=Paenibacillus larvae TaxID=1464 RepID=V9W6V6_9BACL|nr:methionine ABC transporter ATP-binding protein [Paenibacillus larvae]AHD05425.1 methionine import ATP-binding protein MetN [Paenibacillus larvae subsp. larvae DSM 25430]AQR77079.1 methionine ABC transporter ATP-binding protein [Paenibacillus larvae subsp. larvae]AQZ48216.1 methionine ABC transporter ATP-binding protein [Paenibacillus larvae subsp. pulvifaciens]ARF66731.1 methionine ABC transporter ATP-binding protein [Paenibacillus larvae subsp. pulvifaciens]AVF21983.1 methionine import ATP